MAEKEQEPPSSGGGDADANSSLFKVWEGCWCWGAHTPKLNPEPQQHHQACTSGHVGANAAAMAVAYTLLGMCLLQSLSHLIALARWQQEQAHRARGLHQARVRQQQQQQGAFSHDGHTPPGCPPRRGGCDEAVDSMMEDAAAGGCYYYVPPPPFPFSQHHQQQQQPWGGKRGRRGGTAALSSSSLSSGAGAGATSSSFGTDAASSFSPSRHYFPTR